MANQLSLITTKEDFIGSKSLAGVDGVPISPTIYSDAENLAPEIDVVGSTPNFVDGIRGKGVNHGGVTAYKWNNYDFANANKRMLSFWFRPTEADVDPLGGWKILATNRGDGWANYGFHIALYQGKLNVRLYGSNGSISLYTDGGDFPLWRPTAGEWYHICILIGDTGTFPLDVYINKQRIMYSGVPITLGSYTRSFTMGDMLSSSGTLAYTFGGDTDEVIYATDADAWDVATMEAYYDGIVGGEYVQYLDTGSIMLGQNAEGLYSSKPITWESDVLDLGTEGFEAFGRLQVNFEEPTHTNIEITTRSSSDGVSWSEYEALNPDGVILSPDAQFLQVKIEMSTGYLEVSPQVDEIQVLNYEYLQPENLPLFDEPLKVYRDKSSGLEYAGVLVNAFDIEIEEEVNAMDEITFKLPTNDPKRQELGEETVELICEIANRKYIIREVTDKRTSDGKIVTKVHGERSFYELRDFKVKKLSLQKTTAYNAMVQILRNAEPLTEWKIKKVEIPADKLMDFEIEWKSVLTAFRDVVDLWGGEIVFDDSTKEISLLTRIGKDNGVRFYYTKNLKEITRVIDTYDLVTRLYPYGKEGLTISSVNDGKDYVENFTWVDALGLRNRIRVDRWQNNSYIYPQNLKDDGEKILSELAKPRVAYSLGVQDLSSLSGHEHETIGLGDTVYTVDKDLLSLEVESRIVRRKFNVREPWKTVVELSQPKKLLSDAMRKEVDDKITKLETTNLVDTNDVKQMTVFNSLLNSRADEGFLEWQKAGTGFELANVGFSNDWSFKCQGEFGKINSLTQRVYGISHRSAYTVSGAIAKDGDIVRGGTLEEPFVGIKVIIHYTDGTQETKYLAID